jgi:hypothetical protein
MIEEESVNHPLMTEEDLVEGNMKETEDRYLQEKGNTRKKQAETTPRKI